MSSLAALKAKLEKSKKRRSDQTTEEITSETNSNTSDITSLVIRENKLLEDGHDPKEWLEYLDDLSKKVSYPDDFTRYNKFCLTYSRALKTIPVDKNKENGDLARLLLNFADLKRSYNTDEAEAIIDHALCTVRKFAVVHIASAELQIEQGNEAKAKKIINKAGLIYKAEPSELLEIALKNLNEGKPVLLSQEERERGFDRVHFHKDHISSSVAQPVTHPDACKEKKEECNTAPLTLEHTEANSVLRSASKSVIRHYKSTPECHSKSLSSNPFSANKWKRLAKFSVGPPQRVKIKPFDSVGEEQAMEDDTMNSFKPLDIGQKNETFGAQSSGYISSTTHDLEDTSNTQDNIFSNYTSSEIGPPSGHATEEVRNEDMEVPEPSSENKRQCTEEHMTDFNIKTPTVELTNPYHSSRQNSDPQPASGKHVEFMCTDKDSENVVVRKESSTDKDSENVVDRKDSSGDFHPIDTEMSLHKSPSPKVEQVSEKVTPSPDLKRPSAVQHEPVKSPEKLVKPVPAIPDPVHVPTVQPIITSVPLVKPGSEMKVVNGVPYTVLKLAGKGGSAKVYQVFDAENNVRALKCVDLEGSTDIIIQGYKNEINLLKRLQYCDAVIKMYDYDFDQVNNKLNVIMEYGETDLATNLSSRKKGGKRLGDTTVKFYWQEMLRAVNALHKEGIIHSDLKPANFIFVAANLKLIDFGIADAVQQDKTSVLKETLVGTLSYMSPEAIMESCDAPARYKISVKSDVWSLGCILYNMVYNKTPFQHIRNQLAKIQAITSDKHVIEFPDIPDKNLLDVLKSCLVRDPKLRPTTDELLQHPYIAMKPNNESTIASVPKQKNILKIFEQVSEFSPRSLQKFQGMIEQIKNGKFENGQESSVTNPNSDSTPSNPNQAPTYQTSKTEREPLKCIYMAK